MHSNSRNRRENEDRRHRRDRRRRVRGGRSRYDGPCRRRHRIKFHSSQALTADAPPEYARHAVELALDSDTMERYAALDDGTRMRVHAILHDTVQAMLDRVPDTDESLTLTIEVTDAMLDAASHLQ